MDIVVTDGYTLNPGDLSWQAIAALGNLTVYDRTPLNLLIDRCKNATIILTNKAPFDSHMLELLPKLQLISVLATGYNIIDIAAATAKRITVCNVPAYGTASVAQHTFALLLELTNHVGLHAASVAGGEWTRAADWCYTKAPITELAGKVMGIIGFGHIGQQTAAIAQAFGMRVIYYSRTPKENSSAAYMPLETLLAQSDVVSLHCPLTPDNHEFINKPVLQQMKPTALLINTSRGGLIQEQDMADALNNGTIAGAALDVLSTEPPAQNNPLLTAPRCLITPHNAWMSREARQRIMQVTAKNIQAFLEGRPINVVNR